MLKIALYTILCFASFKALATHNGNYIPVKDTTGDLNKDGIPDIVKVSQDTTAETAPYRLQIFFATPDKQYTLFLTSDSAIVPDFPEGREGWRTGTNFSDIAITNGILIITTELLRGSYQHKFRYQKNKFELIGFTEVSSDGQGNMHSIDFNLSTGIRMTTTERYDVDDVKPTVKKDRLNLKTLPDLKTFTPFAANGVELMGR